MALAPEDIQALARALADELESRKPTPAPVVTPVTPVTCPEETLARLYGIDRAAFFVALKKQNAARRQKQKRMKR